MNKKKFIGFVLGVPALVVVLIIIILVNEKAGDGVSRAAAYKAAALAMVSKADCEQKAEDSGKSYFSAKEQTEWYVKYMDYLYSEGILSEELTPANQKTAEGYLTYREADYLACAMSEELTGEVKVTKRNRNDPYPTALFWDLYKKILSKKDTEHKVEEKDVQIYGTPKNIDTAPAWTAYTSSGTMGFEGLGLDAYIDREIRVLVREGEMICVEELVSENITYRNVWLQEGGDDTFYVCAASIRREFPYNASLGSMESLVDNVADVYLEKGKLKKIVLKKERITGKVLAVKEDSIEIEGYGPVALDDPFRVYKVYGEFQQQKMTDILVGYDIQEFVVAGGKLCAALTVREFDAKSIRVLLMDTGFHSTFHQSVTLSADEDMTVVQGDVQETIPAGEDLVIGMDDERLKDGRIMAQLASAEGGISVKSIERAQGVPSYAGRLEISREADGLVLVNELYLEDYLKKVVPSEMPATYEKEALKAQAVCARTYAYRQIRGNSYSQYGAHVDDSTRFQVYNNVLTDAKTDAAVSETYGKLLMYHDRPVEAYYFSTSCGHTTDGTIWGANLADVPYLQGVVLKDSRQTLNLTTNEEFAAFIKDKKYPTYESGYPMYRWEARITNKQLEEKIGGVGTILNLTMIERGTGGIGKTLRVEGSDGNKNIKGQGQIRALLGNKAVEIVKNDGGVLTGWDTLPSAFIAIENEGNDDNNVTTFHIYGGGYGHGVGMSQNGAQGMAKAGKKFEEILKFFFDGVEVKEIE